MRNLEEIYGLVEKDTQTIFVRPRNSTLNSRLREFQFKVLYNIIYTNKHLFMFKMVTDNLCSFCHKTEETYEHLFYACEKITILWEDCGNVFNLPDIRVIDWKGVHVGIEGSSSGEEKLLNHIILLIKYMIFEGRKTSKPPSPQEIKRRLLENKKEERKLAEERGTLTIHFQKWDNLFLQ